MTRWRVANRKRRAARWFEATDRMPLKVGIRMRSIVRHCPQGEVMARLHALSARMIGKSKAEHLADREFMKAMAGYDNWTVQ